jgi:hypothetical protein
MPADGAVICYTLINADTDKDIQTLSNGAILNLATLPTKNLNICANTNPATLHFVIPSKNLSLSDLNRSRNLSISPSQRSFGCAELRSG